MFFPFFVAPLFFQTETTFKYVKDARFCLGVAKVCVEDKNGEIKYEGRRCDTFDYTGKCILSIKDYDKKIKDEIRRVKGLTEKQPPWYIDPRPCGLFWDGDEIEKLPGVGPKMAKSLHSQDITTIADLKLLTIIDIEEMAIALNDTNLTVRKLVKLKESAEMSHSGACPHVVIDYTKADNPYEARFGDNWMNEIKQVQLLQPYVCVTSLVEYLVEATKKVMQGTLYEGKELFFHDALSLMTAHDTVQWMKEKDYYKYWLLPVLGCNDIVGENKSCYARRPVGNSPELMCLDMSLNKDVRECLRMHVSLTQHLNRDNPLRFSLATPKEISRAMTRLVNPGQSSIVPTEKRIIQDVD